MQRKLRKNYVLPAAFLAILLVAAILLGRFLLAPAPEPAPPLAVEEPRPPREILLYFGAQDGSHLTTEAREIPFCPKEEDCLRATVQALLNGPSGQLIAILPPQTALRAIRIEETVATVDFSRALIGGHPGGSMSELFTVYGLVNTLVVNFPHIRQVRLLVEGQALETLKGHVDLREPLSADFSLARSPEEEQSVAPTSGRTPL
jgi:spore germination protein GerM